MLTKILLHFRTLWERFLINFASKLEGRGSQKYWKKQSFWSIFATSANLPTRGHMIGFLMNLAPNLAPKTHQKSTQEAPKTDGKGYRKYNASWLGIWTPLGTDLGGFGRQVGRQVGPKLVPKSEKLGYRKIIKKSLKICDLDSRNRPESWPLRNPFGISKTTIPRVPGIQGTHKSPTTLHYRAWGHGGG